MFEHIDCRRLWNFKITKTGSCLEFDPTQAVKEYKKEIDETLTKDMAFELGENQLSTLGLIVGYNKSDATYGWNGYLGGMTLFYSHIYDAVVEEIHSIPLTAGLTPVVFLQNIQKTYLGKPFTDCIPTQVKNSYNAAYSTPVYKPSNCVYTHLLNTIKSYCNCYPSYIGYLYYSVTV